MENEFVPYELTLRLKALGFDEPCFGSYVFGDKLSIKYCEDQFITESCCLAPTFSQAFRWLRKKYPFIKFHIKQSSWKGEYSEFFDINIKDETKNKTEGIGGFITYEEAELACLEKLIEIVEQKID